MKWIKAMALSAVVTLFAAMLLLSAAGFVICRSGALPRSSLSLITTLIACAAVFLGGLLPGLSLREKGLFLGLGAGALFLVCAGLVTVLVFQAEPDQPQAEGEILIWGYNPVISGYSSAICLVKPFGLRYNSTKTERGDEDENHEEKPSAFGAGPGSGSLPDCLRREGQRWPCWRQLRQRGLHHAGAGGHWGSV